MEFFNSLNLTQIKGGTKLKQGDLGSVLSYSLTDENGQEITSFDNKTAYINLVLDDKIWFTTTTLVDISRVTFSIDKAIPTGLYYLEIKIDNYIFPSDRDSIILIEEGSTPYDLKELVPNYDINMTIKGILSDLSQKGIAITRTEGRIDGLIANAGNGTVPSELIDIRVAYDGRSYNTAGKAVREQITKLSNGILTGNMVLPLVKSEAITNFINPVGLDKISELVPGDNLRYLIIKDILDGGTRVSVQVDKTQATGLNPRFTIAQYDVSSGARVGDLVSGVRDSRTFDLPEGYLYTIIFAINGAGAPDAVLTPANVNTYFNVVITHYSLDYAPKSITLDKISDETIKALSAPPIKTMHMSFDDTWQCLYDLITNKNSYSSIFDNAFLNDLKDVHSATGMVFTLNCFNTYSGQTSYNISGLAELTKFKDEFKNNSFWLRFSFHAQDDTTRYDSDKTSQIVQSYNTFTNAIYKLTGTTDSIDTVVRLGFYTGTLNNCLAIRNAPCGITGLLAADDNRNDYYFDSATRSYLASRGFDYDSTNRLKLCKTIKRLESITDISSELANYDGLVGANKNKRLEFFSHEYAWTPKIKSKLLQIGAWANGRGYSHMYLQDV